MGLKEALLKVFPEIPELDKVDFSQYSPPYPSLLEAYLREGEEGLRGFEEYAKEKTGGLVPVERVLVSLFQYLLIRYRRFCEYSVVKPAVKVFITLKGWLNENGFEREWKLLLHNFAGYLADMMGKIAENEDCELANAYLTTIYRLMEEARNIFPEKYFADLEESAKSILLDFRERCGIGENPRERKGC
ncbi:MAG: hypothetical protein PWQ95_832 [Thermococcaceae archaeon]|nr:hypothetical protein [Thermococcaceae archaeon]